MLHIGADFHKRFTRVVVLDDAGKTVERRTLRHEERDGLTEYFEDKAGRAVVTVEAVRGWYWLYELLEKLGVEMKLVHPRKVRLIAESTIKTDTIDAGTLAQLERTGFLPEAYIPPRKIRDSRELLRHRTALVHIRTGLKNRVHTVIDKLGIYHSFTDLFGTAGRNFLRSLELRPVYQQELDSYLALMEDVEAQLATVTRQIRAAVKPDPRAELLMTIPGVAHIIAYLLLCEIGDIHRFSSAKKLCAYAGLVPKTRQSADHCWQGRITKEGNRYIRWAMTEAACRAPSKDWGLSQYHRRLLRRRGPLKARVAVARKLLVAVWHILTHEEPYKLTKPNTV